MNAMHEKMDYDPLPCTFVPEPQIQRRQVPLIAVYIVAVDFMYPLCWFSINNC